MTPDTILDFWFAEEMQQHWFNSTPELDADIRQRFENVWEQAANGELDTWQETAEGCLALIIILDQLPLNMFRGEAKSFATERQSVAITKLALAQGFDQRLEKSRLSFLFMPLMHSEILEEQDLSVAMFRRYDLKHAIQFAEHHRNIVQTYGRFPHRNAILGRESTPAELAYLNSQEAFTG